MSAIARRVTGLAYCTVPLWLLGAWFVAWPLDDAVPWLTHLFRVAAFVALGFVVVDLVRVLGRRVVSVTVGAVTLGGLLLGVVQLLGGVDAGAATAVVALGVAGLLALAAYERLVPWYASMLVVAGFLVIGVAGQWTPVGLVFLTAALAPRGNTLILAARRRELTRH